MKIVHLRGAGLRWKGLATAALVLALFASRLLAPEGLRAEGEDLQQQSTEPTLDEFPLLSQQTATGTTNAQAGQETDSGAKTEPPPKSKDDRMFFIMPNFLTVDNETKVQPLTWKNKFSITAKGAFDPYEFVIVGVLAGIRQAENSYPGFGQGFEGYGKRYGSALADQLDGNIMVGAVFPSILRTDPRYFQLGRGKFIRRFGYAFSRIFVARKDSGGHTFNLSEFLGNGVAIGISNFYYPASDRGVGSSLSNWGTQLSIDALGNELKEFWPDIHRRLPKKKHTDAQTD